MALLLANAVWRPAALDAAATWCHARGVPAAVVVDASDAAARDRARRDGWALRWVFERTALPPGGAGPGGPLWVEQAAWSRTREAGRLLARRYRRPGFALPLATVVADALRRSDRLELQLAFAGDEVVGAALAWRGETAFSVLLEGGELPPLHAAIHARAAAEGLAAERLQARGTAGRLPNRGVLRLELS